jgi:broad specificity phosphatase PhoE
LPAKLGYAAEKIEANRLFDERDWGSLTGTSGREFYDSGKTLADIDKAEGSEKLQDLQERTRQSLEYLKSKPEAAILLVGHGTFARAMRRTIDGESYTNEYLPNLTRYKNAEVAKLL